MGGPRTTFRALRSSPEISAIKPHRINDVPLAAAEEVASDAPALGRRHDDSGAVSRTGPGVRVGSVTLLSPTGERNRPRGCYFGARADEFHAAEIIFYSAPAGSNVTKYPRRLPFEGTGCASSVRPARPRPPPRRLRVRGAFSWRIATASRIAREPLSQAARTKTRDPDRDPVRLGAPRESCARVRSPTKAPCPGDPRAGISLADFLCQLRSLDVFWYLAALRTVRNPPPTDELNIVRQRFSLTASRVLEKRNYAPDRSPSRGVWAVAGVFFLESSPPFVTLPSPRESSSSRVRAGNRTAPSSLSPRSCSSLGGREFPHRAGATLFGRMQAASPCRWPCGRRDLLPSLADPSLDGELLCRPGIADSAQTCPHCENHQPGSSTALAIEPALGVHPSSSQSRHAAHNPGMLVPRIW